MLQRLKAKLNDDIHFKEILTGSAVTFILKISGMVLGYVVVLIISKQYGAEGIGVYNLTFSIMTFVAMIASMGINVSILRYVAEFNKIGEEYKLTLLFRYALEIVVPLSLLLSVILYFFAELIALNIFHNQIYKNALEIAVFAIPFMAVQLISVEYIRGLKKLKISEILRSVSRPVVNIILLLIFTLFVTDLLLPLYTLGIGIAISAIIAVYYILKNNKFRVAEKMNLSRSHLLATSLPMMITSLSSVIMANISFFFLEVFTTTQEVGVFSVAFKISVLISLVLFAVNTISGPKFSELFWAKKYAELQHTLHHSSRLIFFASFSVSMMFFFFSETILGFFGEEFIVGKTAFLYLIIGQLIYGFSGSASIFLNMVGKQNILRNATVFVMVLDLVLKYLLIPPYGINGAAIASIISAIIINLYMVTYTYKKLNFVLIYPAFLKRKI